MTRKKYSEKEKAVSRVIRACRAREPVFSGRREFLKYLGAAAAVVGGGIGSYQLLERSLSGECDRGIKTDLKDHCDQFSYKDLENKRRLPNIVLIVNDALRYDHFTQELTPNIWELSEKGIRFENAFSGPSTRTCALSLFSGLLPRFEKGDKGLCEHGFSYISPSRNFMEMEFIPDKMITFPEILKEKNYFTLYVSRNPCSGSALGLDSRQWDFMREIYAPKGVADKFGGDALVSAALDLLKDIKTRWPRAPTMLTFWMTDNHQPYDQSHLALHELLLQKDFFKTFPDQKTNLEELIRRMKYFETENRIRLELRKTLLPKIKEFYQNGVRFADRQIGRLVGNVLKMDPFAWIIVASDHGEQFNELDQIWNIGHYGHVPLEITHIPLLIYRKGMKPGVDRGLCEFRDLAKTILSIAGESPPSWMQGRNLLDSARPEIDEVVSPSPYETARIALNRNGVPESRQELPAWM